MKQTTAANLTLALVVAGWIFGTLAFLGALSMMGNPSPAISQPEFAASRERAKHMSVFLLLMSTLYLGSSLGLAGYGFPVARVRASCAVAAFFIPAILAIMRLF